MKKFLQGIKVVAFETAGAGPTATKLLAEYGADVIVVEPVKGVDTRINRSFDFYYQNKRSIAVNLKTDDGMAIMHRLLEDADVFVSNYRKKAVDKFGLDYETLHVKYPRLIHATLTGYGENGPMKDAPGFDVTAYWGRAGLAGAIMERGAEPIVMPFAVGDISAGTMLAGGIMGALFHRERTGEAMKVYISLQGTGIWQNQEQLFYEQCGYHYPLTRKEPRRAHCNSYPLKDGYFQMHTMRAEEDMPKVMKMIGREDLIEHPEFKGHWAEDGKHAEKIREIMDEGFSSMATEEARRLFEEADLPFGVINTPTDVLNDPQAKANQFLYKHKTLLGDEVMYAASPIKFMDDMPAEDTDAPRCGQHTIEILANAGYSENEIQALKMKGIVRSEDL